MEAPPGIEPGMKVLQTSALPLGYGAIFHCYARARRDMLSRSISTGKPALRRFSSGAGNGARTRHLSLGKAALYQMSYSRNGASEWSRTTDTGIFSPLLYQLSYRGKNGDPKGARTPDLQRDRLAY